MFKTFALLAFVAVASATFSSCGNGKEIVQVLDVTHTSANNTITVAIEASSRGHITAANYHMDVSFVGINMISEDGDLCALTSCPLNEGSFIVTKTFPTPAGSVGAYSVAFSAQSDKVGELFCTEFPVSAQPIGDNGDCTVSAALACASKIDGCWTQCKAGLSECIQCLGPMWDQCCPCINAMGIHVTC